MRKWRVTTGRSFTAVFAFLFALSVSLTIHAAAEAAPTPAGTTFSNTTTMSAANATAVSATTASAVVSIFGIATGSEPADSSVSAGGFTYYTIRLTNNANTSDTIKLSVGALSFGTGAGTTTAWSVQVDDADPYVAGLTWHTSGTTSAAQAGDYVTMNLAAGAAGVFNLRIAAAPDAASGATMSAPITLTTSSAPSGPYTGFNGTAYGGLAAAVRTSGTAGPSGNITTSVIGAMVLLTKSVSIVAPTGYQALGGSAANAVPGAKIVYTITYANPGGAGATDVTVTDAAPPDTTFLPGSIVLSDFGAQTQQADGDKCDFGATTPGVLTCNIGTISAGASGKTIQYSVTIN
ncbi:MAG TPA: hypothetical protein PLQ76_00025 [bacterium]|nr:hypothetical protein [bacterium]